MIEHLYIHVPFCAAKCRYCAFHSHPGTEAEMTDYAALIERELESLLEGEPPGEPRHSADKPRLGRSLALQTVFIGGGTPSILPLPLWKSLLEAVGRARCPSAPLEWTIECNPATVDAEKATLWQRAGVNRLSLGVQSFDDNLLAVLGRVHNAAQATETFRLLRDAGFDNLNLDLMFGLPGQTMAQWRDTLDRALALAPEHISAYSLTLEEETAFWGNVQLDDDLQWEMYEQLIAMLTAAGYHHYEISNFAKPGRECVHNLAYWQGKDYLGLGPSAVSTVGLRRWTNGNWRASLPASRDAQAPTARTEPRPPTIEVEQLTEEIKRSERIAFGLRMLDGIPSELVKGRDITQLLADDLVRRSDDRLQLTHRGLRYADTVAAEFV